MTNNKPIKLNVTVQCSKCHKDVKGNMTLKYGDLTVIASSGFLIFDDVVCDICNSDFRDGFGYMIEEACNELGVTPEQLGIDLENHRK